MNNLICKKKFRKNEENPNSYVKLDGTCKICFAYNNVYKCN